MSEDWVEHSPRTEPLQPTDGEYKKCWHVAPPGEILYLLTESWGERKPCLLGHDPIKSGASFTLSWEGADRSSSTTYSLFLPRFSRFPCLYFFFFFHILYALSTTFRDFKRLFILQFSPDVTDVSLGNGSMGFSTLAFQQWNSKYALLLM